MRYNKIISDIIQNSKIVINKVDVFKNSDIVGNNLSTNLQILDNY